MSLKHGFRAVTSRRGANFVSNGQVTQIFSSGCCSWRVNTRQSCTTTSSASTLRRRHSRTPHTIGDEGFSNKSARGYSTNSLSLPEQARHLMRSVPHPVAIVTSLDTSSAGSTAKRKAPDIHSTRQLRGATISSFNTVSLSPTAVVSFNITSLSSTFEAIKQSGQFVVLLLAATAEATELATQFAGGLPHNGGGKGPDVRSLPSVAGTGNGESSEMTATLFAFTCRYLTDKTVAINDHVVVFGEVERIWEPAEQSVEHKPSTDALIYADGRYKMARDLE